MWNRNKLHCFQCSAEVRGGIHNNSPQLPTWLQKESHLRYASESILGKLPERCNQESKTLVGDGQHFYMGCSELNKREKKSRQQLSAKQAVVTSLPPLPFKIGSSQTTASKSCPRQALLGVFSHIDKNICNTLSKVFWGRIKKFKTCQ